MNLSFNPRGESGKRFSEDGKVRPHDGRTGELILMNKQELIQMLLDYENEVKSRREIEPFVNAHFGRMRRLNGVK